MQGCNFAHVLGLYRMSDEAGQAFYLRSRGALADMLLWAIFRLQTRVFASNTYIKCVPLPQLLPCRTGSPGMHGHHPSVCPPQNIKQIAEEIGSLQYCMCSLGGLECRG